VDTIALDTTPPTGFIIINSGDLSTYNPSLNLDLQAYDNFPGQLEYRVSMTPSFGNSTYLPFTDTMLFDARTQNANVTVYYQVRDANGWESIVYSDSIRVREPTCQEANTCLGTGNAPGFDGSFAAVAMALVAAAAVVVRRRQAQ
jgi:hypothetical protein